MLLCNKNYVIFFYWIVQSLIVSEPLMTSINTFRVNTHIISMPENTHDKLSKTKNFVCKIFLYLSFMSDIRGKIKGWALQVGLG